MLRKIVQIGNPVLRDIFLEVKESEITLDKTQSLIDDLIGRA